MGLKKDKKSLKYLVEMFGSQAVYPDIKNFKEKYGEEEFKEAIGETKKKENDIL